LEENPPEEAGAGRARADTAEGNVSTINIYDLGNTEKQAQTAKDYQQFVIKIAGGFLYSGRPLDELVSVGNAGLWKAIIKSGPRGFSAAYARKWIDGEIRRYLKKGYWIVPGARNESGRRLGRQAKEWINHFGNVGIGDGTFQTDASLNAEIENDGDGGDDEGGDGTFLDGVVDRSLERITGNLLERITRDLSTRDRDIVVRAHAGASRKELAAKHGITEERVRQILVAVKARTGSSTPPGIEFKCGDDQDRKFLIERREYYRRGIGIMYRKRDPAPKMSRSLIPHNSLFNSYPEPAWMSCTKAEGCICARCSPAKSVPWEHNRDWLEIFFHWQCVADGRVRKKGKDLPLGKGKPWLYTYNGRIGHKPKKRPKPFGFELLRDAPAPAGEGWRKCGASRGWEAHVRPALRHTDHRGVPLEFPVRVALEGPEKSLGYFKKPGWHWSMPCYLKHVSVWEAKVDYPIAEPRYWNAFLLGAGHDALIVGAVLDNMGWPPEARERPATKFDEPLPVKSHQEWRDKEWPTRWTLEQFMGLDDVPERPNFDEKWWKPTQVPGPAPLPAVSISARRKPSVSRILFIKHERKKPWSKPTVSTLASLCYSSDVSLMPLSPPPVTTTAVRPLTSAKLLQRNSNATA
jgi:RNA polymerase sigma factor (sigma-70 family)